MSGKLIVIEGLDGAGKATQAAALQAALRDDGEAVELLSFPNYGEPYAEPARLYLAGAFGQSAADVNSYAAAVLFAVDRFCSYKADWGARFMAGATMICDRYTTSNALYQTAKLPENEWGDYVDWLFDFEYNKVGIPAPDAVVFLNVDAETSAALMKKRMAQQPEGVHSSLDIHERDLAHQRRSQKAALFCAERQGWSIVECTKDGAMLPVEQIASLVYEAARRAL